MTGSPYHYQRGSIISWLLPILALVVISCSHAADHTSGIALVLPVSGASWALREGASKVVERFLRENGTIEVNGKKCTMNISSQADDLECSALSAWTEIDEAISDDQMRPAVFIGPVCDDALHMGSVLATALNIPLITPGGWNLPLDLRSQVEDFSYTTRVGGSFQELSDFLISLVRAQQWSGVGLIRYSLQPGRLPGNSIEEELLDAHGRSCKSAMGEVSIALQNYEDSNVVVMIKELAETDHSYTDIADVLKRMSPTVNAIFLCGHPSETRNVLSVVGEVTKKGFFSENINLVYIDLLDSSTDEDLLRDYKKVESSEHLENTFNSYKRMTTIRAQERNRTKVLQFLNETVVQASNNTIDVLHKAHETYLVEIYESLILFATACKRLMMNSTSTTCNNGTELQRYIRNIGVFEGVGGSVVMGTNGVRKLEYTLSTFNRKLNKTTVAGVYSLNSNGQYEYTPLDNQASVPSGIDFKSLFPACFWDGSGCRVPQRFKHRMQPAIAVAIIFGLLFGLTVVILGVLCWRQRYPSTRSPHTMQYSNLSHDRDPLDLNEPNREYQDDANRDAKFAEQTLRNMLPDLYAVRLLRGQTVNLGDRFESASVAVLSIVGFGTIAARSLPSQVINLLDDVHTQFDNIVKKFDAHKVTTQGDSYMVVSGAPNQNNNQHAVELARVTLFCLDLARNTPIRHLQGKQLQIRAGINTGPVYTAVLGQTLPRYSVFGETINIASYLASSGLPDHIQISSNTKDILTNFHTFIIRQRDVRELQDAAIVQSSFWLLGENNIKYPTLKPKTEEKL